MIRFVLFATLLSACASDDVSFTDGGSNTPDAASATCGAPFGSCHAPGESMCDDYAGAIPPAQARDNCMASNGTWSDSPCTTTGTVGACRFEQATPGHWCVTTWWFPPETTDSAMNACPSPGVFVPP